MVTATLTLSRRIMQVTPYRFCQETAPAVSALGGQPFCGRSGPGLSRSGISTETESPISSRPIPGGNNVSVLLGDGAGGFMLAAGSPFAAGKAPRSRCGRLQWRWQTRYRRSQQRRSEPDHPARKRDRRFAPSSSSPFALGTVSPQSLAVGDFNGDGVPDVAVTAYHQQSCGPPWAMWIGRVSRSAQSFTVDPFRTIAAADLNADGRLDIVTANSGGNTVSVLLGNGTGGFTAAPAVRSPWA